MSFIKIFSYLKSRSLIKLIKIFEICWAGLLHLIDLDKLYESYVSIKTAVLCRM